MRTVHTKSAEKSSTKHEYESYILKKILIPRPVLSKKRSQVIQSSPDYIILTSVP